MDNSDDESAPPEPAGEAVGADDLPDANGGAAATAAAPPPPPQHPVWAASAGAGARANNASKNKAGSSMFGPISMMELEIRGRGDLDGASSTASDRGRRNDKERPKRGKDKKARKRVREYDDDDDEGEGEEDDTDRDGADSSASADIAGAAFGGAANKRTCRPCASVTGVHVDGQRPIGTEKASL